MPKNTTVLLCLIALGCRDQSNETGEDNHLLNVDFSQRGPYAAGTLSAEIVGTDDIALTVQVWFPADVAGSDVVNYDELLEGSATTDATPSCTTRRPVLMFSHGYGGIRWQSPFFVEHLASHGYIVVAPDHTGNTFLDNDDSQFDALILRRPQDIVDSFDWLITQSNDSANALAGCIDDTDGYAVSGHSFGGYTAYATSGATVNSPAGETVDLGDDRVWGVLPLAPWDADGAITDGTATVSAPVMCLSGYLDESTDWPMVVGMFDDVTTTPRYLGELTHAGHYSFSPIACTFGLSGDGCGDEFTDLDVVAALVNTSALAFLEEIRGMTGAIEQLPEDSEGLTWESTLQ